MLLAPLSDPREREEFVSDLEALRTERGHGRLWYWREMIRYGVALRLDPSLVGKPLAHGTVGRQGRVPAQSIFADLRYALRLFVRTPGLSLVAVPTIALSVGASTALFSFADALILRPLPVAAPDRLLSLFHVTTDGPRVYSSFSYPDYVDLRDLSRLPEGVAAFSSIEVRLGRDEESEPVQGYIVSGNYFSVLGLAPSIGRPFLPEEDRTPGTHPVVVISQGLLDRQLGGDPSVVGQTITLNGRPFTVVGVAARGTPSLDLGTRPELWVPLMMHEAVLPGFQAFGVELFGNRGTHWLEVIVRLPEGVTRDALDAELHAVALRQAVEHPETNGGWSIQTSRPADARTGPPSARPLVRLTALLAAVVIMLLLIGCANIANLLLAKAATRAQEMGVRLSVGASRSRLLRQMLTEALLLAAIGGGAGLLVALGLVRALPALDLTSGLAGLDVRLDTRVLVFALSVTVATGVLFGIVPAWKASSTGLATAHRSSSGRRSASPMIRQSLVVTQVALALVLLVGAGLTLRTLWNLGRTPLGFQVRDLLLASVDLTSVRSGPEDDASLRARILEEVRSIPGVRDVSFARISPFSGNRMANDFLWETSDSAGNRGRTNFDMNVVDPAYFRVMGVPLVAGRTFTEEERAGGPGVAVVNQALAERLWPGESAVGKTIWSWSSGGNDQQLEVVGVVANGRYYRSWRTADRPFVFLPLGQNGARTLTLHVRAEGMSRMTEDGVRRVIFAADPDISPPRIQGAASAMASSVALERANARLLTIFGTLATIVALIGVYGVVSFIVSQRTHEIGVRMALGARPRDVRRMILIGSTRSIALGIALGLAAAALLARFLTPLLYEVGPRDPLTFAVVAGVVVTAGVLASFLPARRATRVDPLLALQE